MKCIICKSPDIVVKEVDEKIKLDNDIALYPVNVKVCNNCGERYYDRNTMQQLEDVKEKLKNKELTLQVVGKVVRVAV